MTKKEAVKWIKGELSLANSIQQHPLETWQERIANADAGMVKQAYYVLMAHQNLELFRDQFVALNRGEK